MPHSRDGENATARDQMSQPRPMVSERHAQTQAERAWRERGYRDGYLGRPKKSDHPIYLRHYAIGASAWTREQTAELEAWTAELEAWEAAHRG